MRDAFWESRISKEFCNGEIDASLVVFLETALLYIFHCDTIMRQAWPHVPFDV